MRGVTAGRRRESRPVVVAALRRAEGLMIWVPVVIGLAVGGMMILAASRWAASSPPPAPPARPAPATDKQRAYLRVLLAERAAEVGNRQPGAVTQLAPRSRVVERRFRGVLGMLLASERRSRNLTQAAVAKGVRRPQSWVSKLESGQRHLEVTDLLEIAAVIGMDAAVFAARLRTMWEVRG